MMETVPSGTILHGRYRIERVLGSGGFGHVYLAIDLITNQQYAIKEYFVTGASGQAQLQHEARVLSQLHHPNLPAFQEAFDQRGHYFVVLSYIEGSDLTDRIRIARQRNEIIPLPQIMGWILSICDAVQFLHSQQPVVIHRDIKPDNIRIMLDGTAILVDLGNAKATADGARTLFFIRHQGTPGYAPQEQYPGGTGTDVRSDIYALGATLYFALTSHEPPSVSLRNQSIQQGLPDLPSLQEILAKNPPENNAEANAGRQFRLGVTKPTKPVPRHLRHLAQLGSLPPPLLDQLNAIIKRAMAMKQKDRYPTVAEFSNDLNRVMAALPAPPSAPTQRPVDPNSTQPDLPLLYETIQRAKENADKASPGEANNPPAQPANRPAPTPVCPRCGESLLQQSSFCPRCGSSLNNVFKASASTTVAEPDSKVKKTSQQDKSPAHDASLDKTMIIKQQAVEGSVSRGSGERISSGADRAMREGKERSEASLADIAMGKGYQAKVLTYPQQPQKPAANPFAIPSQAGQMKQPGVQVQNNPAIKNAVRSPIAPAVSAPPSPPKNSNPPARASGFNMTFRIFIIAAIIVLLVVIAIIVLLLSRHGHSSNALQMNELLFSFCSLVLRFDTADQ